MSTGSPRHKMVVVAPSQPSEVEQKRRKQTLERARANHLSKQLQMRLQYAKLKVEYGWQRQNLNEVENLYFHHSHIRNTRPNVVPRNHYPNVSKTPTPTSDPLPPAPVPVDTNTNQPPASPSPPDQTAGQSSLHQPTSSPPLVSESSPPGSVSSPAQSHSEQLPNSDGEQAVSQLASQLDSQPPLQTLIPAVAAVTDHPQPIIDLSDPNILARIAQLQTQMQSQSPPQTVSRQSSTTIPESTSSSQPGPSSFPSQINPFATQLQSSFPSQPFTTQQQSNFTPPYIPTPTGSQPLFNAPMPTAVYPTLPPNTTTSLSTSTTNNTTTPTTQTSIAPVLTYDSFWSTHASSAGPTRSLYRTHTGFTATAAASGNVAMITPGGHAAIMTADGVYVGSGRTG